MSQKQPDSLKISPQLDIAGWTDVVKLESALEEAVKTLEHDNESTGEIPIHRLPFKEKIELFDSLCRQRRPDLANDSVHEDMIKQLVLLGDRYVRMSHQTTDPHSNRSQEEWFSQTDLRTLATEMANTERDLRSYLSTLLENRI